MTRPAGIVAGQVGCPLRRRVRAGAAMVLYTEEPAAQRVPNPESKITARAVTGVDGKARP